MSGLISGFSPFARGSDKVSWGRNYFSRVSPPGLIKITCAQSRPKQVYAFCMDPGCGGEVVHGGGRAICLYLAHMEQCIQKIDRDIWGL